MANAFTKVSFANASPRGNGDNRLNSIPAKAKHLNDVIGTMTSGANTHYDNIVSCTNYVKWATGDYSGLSLATKSDANCDSGFTFAANTYHECAPVGDATNAFVLPAATAGTLVVMGITAQWDGGNNATFTTATGDFYAAQTLNFITQNAGDTVRLNSTFGTDFSTTQSLGKISTLTAAHNTLTLSTTATNNQSNKGAELAFYCATAGFWRLKWTGSELGSGAMNATFAGSTA